MNTSNKHETNETGTRMSVQAITHLNLAISNLNVWYFTHKKLHVLKARRTVSMSQTVFLMSRCFILRLELKLSTYFSVQTYFSEVCC